jgi:hypothetical protein
MTTPQDPHRHLPTGRLDPALDPDRYDPAREAAGPPPPDPVVSEGPLDWALDPDRYDPAADPSRVRGPREPLKLGRTGGTSQTLPDLLAEGSFEDKPSPYMFLLGLLGIAAFLGLVAFVFSHLSP